MKKFLALALCALMMLSVLTACGGNGPRQQQSRLCLWLCRSRGPRGL